MTTVSDIMDRAGRLCSLTSGGWLSDTSLEAMELKDFLGQTVDDIRDRTDIAGPMAKTVTLTGDGSAEYALPDDFYRLCRDPLAVFETTNAQRACWPVSTDGGWDMLEQRGFSGAGRYYRLRGYDGAWVMGFLGTLTTGQEVNVSYISTVWLANMGTEKAEWTDEADVCMFPRALVETGVVYRFRERKGLEFAGVRAQHEVLMARFNNDGKSRRRVTFGETRPWSPFSIPVPDYIPEA